jgi:polynucleotide 5'-hydroxyl-kinase GRC3/NOL9
VLSGKLHQVKNVFILSLRYMYSPVNNGSTCTNLPQIFTATTGIPTLTIPLPWKSTLTTLTKKSSATPPPVILIAGSKNTGKSTFARILTNKLLTSSVENVVYLDVDPGQPEFSPPGIISLNFLSTPILGPPFSHADLTTALKAHHIGYVSPREDPGHYINCIADLLSYYYSTFPTLPLIINSAGWTKGLGLELLQEILTYAQPSEIVFLGSSTPPEVIPTSATTTLHELPAAPVTPAQPRYTPADLRTLQTMSYFHGQTTDWDCSSSLTGFAPWVVPYRNPAGVVAIHISVAAAAESTQVNSQPPSKGL